MKCVVCGGKTWVALPNPMPNQAITTAGVLTSQPIARFHCTECGLIQRGEGVALGLSDFYETQYQRYYRRPGNMFFDRHRYAVMAKWMHSALGDDFLPTRILDVGCGIGNSIRETQVIYPNAVIEGIEPSESNSNLAREAGFTVHKTRIGDEHFGAGKDIEGRFDLIYSQNVLMHVVDPVAFLSALSERLTEEGKMAVICPDATLPSNELLWCDHNFSFLPENLGALGKACGLDLVCWSSNPEDATVFDKQLAIFARSDHFTEPCLPPACPDLGSLAQSRARYLSDWADLDAYLCARTDGASRVFNFGASMWTWLLAGNCPKYWSRVTACTVDGFNGECLDKGTLKFEAINWESNDALVLGVNPVSQPALEARFIHEAFKTIAWNHRVIR